MMKKELVNVETEFFQCEEKGKKKDLKMNRASGSYGIIAKCLQ